MPASTLLRDVGPLAVQMAYADPVAPEIALYGLLAHASLVGMLSLVTFTAYAIDKRRSKTSARRIPERTLHRLAWLGGFPGGWVGRHTLRHKTRKRGFAERLTGATLVHVGIATSLAWAWLR